MSVDQVLQLQQEQQNVFQGFIVLSDLEQWYHVLQENIDQQLSFLLLLEIVQQDIIVKSKLQLRLQRMVLPETFVLVVIIVHLDRLHLLLAQLENI